MLDKFLYYFILYIMYSFLGWCMEMVVCYADSKKWVNRGFLLGPICPIYGWGCLIITILLERYLKDPIALFVMALVLCSLLEYFTSYIMEKFFKARWWDYSNDKYNINGRICLRNSLAFGILGLLLSYVIHPFLVKIIGFIPVSILNIVSIVILVVYIVDNVISFKVISGFTKVAKNIKKDSTEEITKKVREILAKKGYLYRRLVSAFNFQASEKLIKNIASIPKKIIVTGIDITNQTREMIIEEYNERIKDLKIKIEEANKIKEEKLSKIKEEKKKK